MLKRTFDLLLALLLIVPLLPIMIVEAAAIALESGFPFLFDQERVGKDGKPFTLYKFRTMLPIEKCLGPDGKPVHENHRITRLGYFLRRTSLDELPQIFNILRGDMSFIGPRPTLQYQVDRYDAFQRRRLQVKPGITGLAQVNGRNNLTWEEKIRYDVTYVETRSFYLDLQILLKTFKVVLGAKNTEFVKNDKLSDLD